MEKKYRQVGLQFKAVQEDGTVEAIVSVFGNVDSYGDMVMPGAFAKSLATKLPKGVWMHDWEEPICTVVEARELMPFDPSLPESIRSNGGLYVKMQFYPDIEDSWQAYLKIKYGLVDEFSIGYSCEAWQVSDGVMQLLEVKLYEVSPVLVGANSMTAVLSVKSNLTFSEDLAGMLRDLQRFAARVQDRKEYREKAGRVFSAANVETLTGIADTLDSISEMTSGEASSIRSMIDAAQTTQKTVATELQLLKLKMKMKGQL